MNIVKSVTAASLTVLFLLGSGVAPSAAQERDTTRTVRNSENGNRPSASIDDLSWLTGRWVGRGLGATVEEVWLPARGGAMVGVFRLVREDSVQFYELVTLVEEEGSLSLRLKHFGPDLVGWEEKTESVSFPLVRRTSDALWFDGLTIRRVADDRMRIWVALDGEGRDTREVLFEYRRVADEEG